MGVQMKYAEGNVLQDDVLLLSPLFILLWNMGIFISILVILSMALCRLLDSRRRERLRER